MAVYGPNPLSRGPRHPYTHANVIADEQLRWQQPVARLPALLLLLSVLAIVGGVVWSYTNTHTSEAVGE